jgi:ABC-2 type transport system permease protein
MKQLRVLLHFEWLNFRAERSLVAFCILMLLCGFYGIFSGHHEIEKQRNKLAGLEQIYQNNIAEMAEKFPDSADAGDIGYYHSAFAKNKPNNWAALAIGQRDVSPAYLKIRLLAVQNQLYNSENTNPLKLATGSFDLSFVMVFLLPLFIIAISFNLLSAEKEQGTLRLLLAQPLRLSTLFVAKVLFRFIIIAAIVLILSFIALWWTAAQVDLRAFYWILGVLLYAIFWLGMSCAIAAMQRSSAFNAISLLGVWLLLAVIAPVLINAVADISKPVQEGLELTMVQREAVHGGWDKPKTETMQKFFDYYPQYENTGSVEGAFKWKWYYAFQELGDRSVEGLYQAYRQKMLDRQALTSTLSVVSPPAKLQEILNGIAGTDLQQHLDFIAGTKAYHEKLKGFYYPYLYQDLAFQHADFSKEPQYTFEAVPDYVSAKTGILVLLAANAVALLLTLIIFKSNTQELK